MATVWYLEYNDGTAKTLSFDRAEAESRRIVTNCPEDVQTYKNGLSRVYSGPVSWRTATLSFRLIRGTLVKVRTLAAVRVPVKLYYHYHVNHTDYIWCNIVPEKAEKYFAGFLSAENIDLEFVETEAVT